MMKNLLLLIVFFGVGYVAYQEYTALERTGIPAYSESRFLFTVGRRDLEFVSFTRRDSSERCELAKAWMASTVLSCDAQPNCQVKEMSCRDQIPDRYLRMFDGDSASSTYLRVQHAESGRAGILVTWGLTRNESRQICEGMRSSLSASKEQFEAACL